MRQAVLTVYFKIGQAPSAWMKSLEQMLQRAAPEAAVFRTAASIGHGRPVHFASKDPFADLSQALCALQEQGYTHVFVQPTYLLDGVKYEELLTCVREWADKFTSLVPIPPLLAGVDDVYRLASILNRHYPPKQEETLLFIGHGTNCFSHMVYPALQGIFYTMGREDVLIGTIDGRPDDRDIFSRLKQRRCKNVHLIPLMITAGKHARQDIAGEGTSWKSRLEQEGYGVTCTMKGLGELPEVQALMAGHLRSALRKQEEEKSAGGNGV